MTLTDKILSIFKKNKTLISIQLPFKQHSYRWVLSILIVLNQIKKWAKLKSPAQFDYFVQSSFVLLSVRWLELQEIWKKYPNIYAFCKNHVPPTMIYNVRVRTAPRQIQLLYFQINDHTINS